MNKKLFVLLPAAMLMLTACGGGGESSTSGTGLNPSTEPTPSTEPEPSTEPAPSTDPSTDPSSEPVPQTNYGTLENPITMLDAWKIAIAECTDENGDWKSGAWSAQPVVVRGKARYNGVAGKQGGWGGSDYTFYVVDFEKPNASFEVYKGKKAAEADPTAYENDTIVVSGYINVYVNTNQGYTVVELNRKKIDDDYVNPTVHSVTRGESPITANTFEHGHFEEALPEKVANDTDLVFKVVADEGYRAEVTVNGAALDPVEGVYTHHVIGDVEIAVEMKDASEAETDYGTVEAPISVSDVLAIAAEECVENKSYTKKPVVFRGVVKENVTRTKAYFQNVTVLDETDNTKELLCYSFNLSEGITDETLLAGDVLTLTGYIVNWNSTIELSNKNSEYPVLLSYTRPVVEVAITLGDHEHATVTGLPEKASTGDEVTFTVTADAGYRIDKVKANGTLLTGEEGTYKFVVSGATEITVEAVEESVPATDYGTETSPITVEAALAIAAEECAEAGSNTVQEVVVKGKVNRAPTLNGTYGFKNVYLVDEGKEPELLIYTVNFGAVEKLYKNDEFTAKGYIKNYNGTIEMTNISSSTYPVGIARTAGESAITLGDHEHATVTGLPELGKAVNDTTVEFTVAADSGYELVAVKVNDAALNAVEGKYTFEVKGDMEVTVTTKEEGAAEDQVLATFTLGADGNASHSDGSGVTDGQSYEETVSGYTLTVANCLKVSKNARDAKGNGCLKIGTSSATASFEITLPEGVDYAIILVGGYKNTAAKISVNGGAEQTISKLSNNGEYEEVRVENDATSGKVTFVTVTGGVRAMINGIIFMKAAA